MTEILHSREYRAEQLKQIIMDLHQGKSAEEVKPRFQSLIKDIGPTEIANLEQELIRGGLPETEIKRLCDVHVSVFRDALDEQTHVDEVPGHPVHTFRQENRAIEELLERLEPILSQVTSDDSVKRQRAIDDWRQLHDRLMELEKHYNRKENVVFPYLERYGISGPPSVMWSIHDETRAQWKQIRKFLSGADTASQADIRAIIETSVRPMLKAITDMIYKESKILFPMCLETLTEVEWDEIYRQSDEIGYTLITPDRQWQPKILHPMPTAQRVDAGAIPLDTGALTSDQINLMLKSLPIDMTFVDEENKVRYYSQGRERIFTRTPAIIGRSVEMCHPPESVHVVKEIVQDFKEGKRDTAEFWLTLSGKFIHIRYFAVRDDAGKYRGVIEVSQDLTDLRALKGQKRLLEEPSLGSPQSTVKLEK